MATARSIIIKVTNDFIWFNDNTSIALTQTNLPCDDFKFVQGRTIFWEAEMLSFDRNNAELIIQIINYRPENVNHYYNQQPKNQILKLKFQNIYWPAFCADLSFYKKASFLNLLSENPPFSPDKNIKTVHITANIAFSKVRFGAGYVAFDYRFLWNDHKTEIKIMDGHLIPEFDYVKTYFSKYFNSRTFEVLIVVTKTGNNIQNIVATSRQIEQIKDAAIENLKFVKVQLFKKPPKYIKELNQSLFTQEDVFDPFDKNLKGTFPMTQKELFDQIMKWEDIRNKRQIEFLSGHLHEVNEKIRFTLIPDFGFLFVTYGDRMYHYIWEMLNTNATYIWSFEKTTWAPAERLAKLEEVISFIRNNGRDTYLRHVSPHEKVLFRRILHQGAGSNIADFFPRWRHAVLEAIV